ncbi:MAG: type I CRISPR-associated protein Cas7 [Thermoanaerobaculales bacterium]
MPNESLGNKQLMRVTGLLVIEAINSNPNGDPDRESDPRQRPDERGEISPVSFKRKVRDLVEEKEGPVWASIAGRFAPPLAPAEFSILESRGRDRKTIEKEIKAGTFVSRYWDGRVFGNTFLEEGASTSIKTGVAQFGLAVSVAPILIERMTNTNMAGVQEGKDRGMAPLAYRIVQHGVYCMPFFINPQVAGKSGCTERDIDVLRHVIPFAYRQTASYVRPFVGLRHAWWIEHKSALGSCSDFALIGALMPKKRAEPNQPSKGWDEYDVPSKLPPELEARIAACLDLMNA